MVGKTIRSNTKQTKKGLWKYLTAADRGDYLRTNLHFKMSQFEKQKTSSTNAPLTNASTRTTNKNINEEITPSLSFTVITAIIYILSGVTQPLLVALAKNAGLADPRCQLYMTFYYLGPAGMIFAVICPKKDREGVRVSSSWPARGTILKSAAIASVDILAQTMNYTGSSYAGPTIFAIIYSSVTIWTALFSRILLKRLMSPLQWTGVVLVFAGLAITACNVTSFGPKVFHGACLVTVGSIMHALTYVMSEAIMTDKSERLSVPQNCAVQGIVASVVFSVWQLTFTSRHFTELIQEPMNAAGTTWQTGSIILLSFGIANLIHALSFFYTLKYFPGGATSAGIMKGLQAVLVFIVTSLVFCGRLGGNEMCFTPLKLLSLVVVVGGVLIFGKGTTQSGSQGSNNGYSRIGSTDDNVEVV